jgi:hypothetical protein
MGVIYRVTSEKGIFSWVNLIRKKRIVNPATKAFMRKKTEQLYLC